MENWREVRGREWTKARKKKKETIKCRRKKEKNNKRKNNIEAGSMNWKNEKIEEKKKLEKENNKLRVKKVK